MTFLDSRTSRVLFTAFLFAVGLGFLYAARRTLILFLFAILFAYLINPAVGRLEKLLRSRVWEVEEEKRQSKIDAERKAQIGRGGRSEKIRTYNVPQDRITDHRIKRSWHNITQIMDGDLDQVVQAVKLGKKGTDEEE